MDSLTFYLLVCVNVIEAIHLVLVEPDGGEGWVTMLAFEGGVGGRFEERREGR